MKRKPLKPKKSYPVGLDGFSQYLRDRSKELDKQYPPGPVNWSKLFTSLKYPKLKL